MILTNVLQPSLQAESRVASVKEQQKKTPNSIGGSE